MEHGLVIEWNGTWFDHRMEWNMVESWNEMELCLMFVLELRSEYCQSSIGQPNVTHVC